MAKLLTCLLLALAACSTARVSTPDERAAANTTLSTIEVSITALGVAGELSPAETQQALAQVRDLRLVVAQSETTPMSWSDVLLRITNLAAQWLGPR